MLPRNHLSRRSALVLLSAAAFPAVTCAQSSDDLRIMIYKDPSCSCCGNWANYMQSEGFTTIIRETNDIAGEKIRFGVPTNLASCHTAIIAGYVIEGHIPAAAVKRLLNERPNAIGLAVPGMPSGAPGMEVPGIAASNEVYDVILFGTVNRSTYMRFRGYQQL